jgi:hypothetical protein
MGEVYTIKDNSKRPAVPAAAALGLKICRSPAAGEKEAAETPLT